MAEFKQYSKELPDVGRHFLVYDISDKMVTMVRVRHPDADDEGYAVWDPHTGEDCFGDITPLDLWCYAPMPDTEG